MAFKEGNLVRIRQFAIGKDFTCDGSSDCILEEGILGIVVSVYHAPDIYMTHDSSCYADILFGNNIVYQIGIEELQLI
jgi:hypothetical protein